MASRERDRIVDSDGHVMEDMEAIVRRMPEPYWAGFNRLIRSPFPPLDHLHSANKLDMPPGSFT